MKFIAGSTDMLDATLLAWLDWQPRVGLPVWLAFVVVVGVVWMAYGHASRSRLTGGRHRWTLLWMLWAGIVPLILLLNPVWVDALPPPDGRPLVTLVIDTSTSMNVADDAANPDQTRIVRSIGLASRISESLEKIYETRWMTFDEFARRGPPMTSGQTIEVGRRSDVASALTSAVQGDRPRGQAVVLLSDGVHNVGSADRAIAAARASRSRGAAVFPVAVANPIEVKNVAVRCGNTMRMAFVDQPAMVTATIQSRGLPAATMRVDLMRGDEIVESRSLILDKDRSLDVDFTIQPQDVGLFRYEIRVASMAGEASTRDNTGSVTVRVLDSPIGVLLLEGKPYWDSKFLARNLAADPSIRLESLVMLKSDRFLHRIQSDDDAVSKWEILPDPSAVLGRSESLRNYQIIVLGRDAEAYLDDTTMARLRDWVAKDGGSIVCARGAPQSTLSARLGRMLPVRWTDSTERRTRVRLTAGSDVEGWIAVTSDSDPLAAMPSLVTAAAPQTRGGLPRVLARGGEGDDAIPIVSYQPFGSGRTVVVEGIGMWRWALLPPDFAAADRTYGKLWNGLLQWLVSRVALAPGQDRTLQTDQIQFSTEDIASATLLVRETVSAAEPPRVKLTREETAAVTDVFAEPVGDAPGVYQVRFGQLAEGSYRAELIDAGPSDRHETGFEVRQPIGEALELNPDSDLLEAIATQSGGQVLRSTDVDEIVRTIDAEITAGLPVQTTQTPAWDRGWVLILTMMLLSAGWIVRRRNGLI